MNLLLLLSVFVPIAVSLLCFIFKKWASGAALLTALFIFVIAVLIFLGAETAKLSSAVFLFAALFTFLIVLYSLKFMEGKERLGEYYGYILISLGAAAGVVFTSNYMALLLFWGILGITLYLLIGLGEEASSAAKKTFIIVGGADALMILGAAIIWRITGSFNIGAIKLSLNNSLAVLAFFSLLAGAFAKAGAMPLHSWIPDSSEAAPLPVMAYLPAALDKLLGIYLLFRLVTEVFIIEPNSPVSTFLLIIGSVTIIAAVMGALVQHNLKKLLSFCAVSQVGYIVLGIGTGIPVGIAGGLFHMFNHAIYKCCLFLTAGAVEKETGTCELDRLGGLAKFMPLTFISTLIAALSISGVPPFNGFVSKWMIYQGVIELGKSSPYWIIWLTAAMFGSALTLASFMKIIHAVFLGQGNLRAKEVPWSMSLPMLILAVLCLVFGVFAYSIPLAYFVFPLVREVKFLGLWDPNLATGLIILGLLFGGIIYWLGRKKEITVKPAYVGGEELEIKISGVDFYNTIKEWGFLQRVYQISEKKVFDIYEIGARITFGFSSVLKSLHSGLLHTYLAWMFLGMIVLLWVLMR